MTSSGLSDPSKMLFWKGKGSKSLQHSDPVLMGLTSIPLRHNGSRELETEGMLLETLSAATRRSSLLSLAGVIRALVSEYSFFCWGPFERYMSTVKQLKTTITNNI